MPVIGGDGTDPLRRRSRAGLDGATATPGSRGACDTGGVQREIRPESIAPPAANYAHAVLSESTTRWLHTSGVVPTAPDGSTPDDVGEQAAVVWRNIAAMLDEAAMTPSDIVSVTTYVVVGEPLVPVMAARDEFLAGHRAASTLVTVPALAQPRWRMEVAIVAAH
jgi:enamine deaminase RidA (YjgF/YER057c/UK114 family)